MALPFTSHHTRSPPSPASTQSPSGQSCKTCTLTSRCSSTTIPPDRRPCIRVHPPAASSRKISRSLQSTIVSTSNLPRLRPLSRRRYSQSSANSSPQQLPPPPTRLLPLRNYRHRRPSASRSPKTPLKLPNYSKPQLPIRRPRKC